MLQWTVGLIWVSLFVVCYLWICTGWNLVSSRLYRSEIIRRVCTISAFEPHREAGTRHFDLATSCFDFVFVFVLVFSACSGLSAQ